jgi:phosphocarrier protein
VTADAAGSRRTVEIVNERGLHARAAAEFVKLAERFEAEITVARAGTEVSGRSILGLMMLGASPGTEVDLAASGRQAEEALEALATLVANKFHED